MNRRELLAGLFAATAAGLLVPETALPNARRIFLPPAGGWATVAGGQTWTVYGDPPLAMEVAGQATMWVRMMATIKHADGSRLTSDWFPVPVEDPYSVSALVKLKPIPAGELHSDSGLVAFREWKG